MSAAIGGFLFGIPVGFVLGIVFVGVTTSETK